MVKRLKIKKPKLPKIKRAAKRIKNDVPGSLVYTGYKEQKDLNIDIIDFGPDQYESITVTDVEKAFNKKSSGLKTWININGLNEAEPIARLGSHYNLHPLVMEDIVDTNQRPKIDQYPDYLFIVCKMLYFKEDGTFVNEHLSLVLGTDYVITFQEADGDVFDSLRKRIETGRGRLRTGGADYLMFAILDAVVDHYFMVMETMSERIEELEDDLLIKHRHEDMTQDIQDLKREVLRIRKAINPLREVVNRLENSTSELIKEQTVNFLRDLHDHVSQVSESIDIYREMTRGLVDMYMSTISNKMNEVMKVLTIMASIFIPLTFIAGVYGMNFEYMPELQWRYGYFYTWGFMILVFLGLIWYFKRKNWL